MNRCGVRIALAALCGATVLAAVSVALRSTEAQQANSTNCPRVAPQRPNWVVRVECDDKGQPLYVEHKWPFGSPDNIGLVRVPWGYRDLLFGPSVGAQLTSNAHPPFVDQGYGELWFWALLPNVSKHNERTPPVTTSVREFDLMTAKVMPVINKRYPAWDAEGWLRRTAESLRLRLPRAPGYRDIPIVALEGRYDLDLLPNFPPVIS